MLSDHGIPAIICEDRRQETVMYNIFLTGAKRTGKSSLIRKCLVPYRDALGGFSSQRLLDVSGKIIGYRITDAADFEVEKLYEPSLPGIFMLRGIVDRACYTMENTIDLSVFRDHVTKMLIPEDQTLIMLLDEIGGVEMLDPEFRSRLYELLESDMPCIGVLKENKDSANNAAFSSEAASLRSENLMLQEFLDNDPSSCLICLTDCGPLFSQDATEVSAEAERMIRDFLSQIVRTN